MNIVLDSTKPNQKTFRDLNVGSIFTLATDLLSQKSFYMKIGGGFAVRLPRPAHRLSFSEDTPVKEYKATLKLEEM